MLNIHLENSKQTKFILIGEIHGIKENIEILKSIIQSYLKSKNNNKLILALEWPYQLTDEINKYIDNNLTQLKWQKWDFIKNNDGRISKEHILFLKWLKNINRNLLKNKKIKIQCFDVIEKKWNKRDKKMANILLKLKKRKNIQLVAIMGNFHASKMVFYFGGNKYIPLGSYFPLDTTISIKLEYCSGYFYNEYSKKIPSHKNINTIKKSKLQKNKKSEYDYIFLIKKAHSTKPLY
ncbi:hypothetical protein HZC33_01180 [Candidatus Wolfebacteria bacterium]|nr:hypothetical protein [Candidatus Wolfebacteria bacterium]